MSALAWEPLPDRERHILATTISRVSRHRGKVPDAVYVVRRESGNYSHCAMQYVEDGKWERWGIQLSPPDEIRETWSTLLSWLRPLIGDRALMEVYPRDDDVVNTAPTRWFWVLPDGLRPEFDIRDNPTPEPP